MSLERTLEWFKEAVPVPTKNVQLIQTGVHFEEVAEMIEQISIPGYEEIVLRAKTSLIELATLLKTNKTITLKILDRKEFLDAIVDQMVTGTGTAYQFGMDVLGGLNEVNDSNYSKFDESGKAIFDENGKIAKNKSTYRKAELAPFVGIDVTELENPPL